jgi:hypothetical protein
MYRDDEVVPPVATLEMQNEGAGAKALQERTSKAAKTKVR